MRLLHFTDFGSLALTDFTGKTIPPYAILSHTWDGSTEVLFEDLRDETYKLKKGYRKIEFCAKQAAQDQLQYFWIDTCCIDKWNLPELSKSINSMFRWYENATRCYVFLPDVSVPDSAEIDQRSAWEASFRASRWFTRGWTLQELIAPVLVDFFSSEGRLLGDKRSLEQLIHDITGIPIKALNNDPLDEFTLSERMEWARNRTTTEQEDNAYCLLGILGVVMAASYGEGKEKAMERLRVEVEATSSIPSIIPFSQNDKFVGRESQLAELETMLFGGEQKQTTKIAITGPGGTGKSQLALELAYRTRQKHSCSVFWVDASDIDTLNQAYAGIAQKLDIFGWKDEKADFKQLVKLHLGWKTTERWLLIFDNTIDLSLGSRSLSTPQAVNLVDYLPRSELGSIVFITTDSNTVETLAPQNIVELQEMASGTAKRMFENHLTTPPSQSEHDEVTLLLEELSYLPLAIVQSAAYINNSRGMTLSNYRLQVIKQKEALKLSSELAEDGLEYGPESPIAATLLISLDQIQNTHPPAADYLFLAACVDWKDIPIDLLGTGLEREDTIRILNSYALVTRRPAQSALDLHRLVHLAIRNRLEKQECLSQWTQNSIGRLLKLFPDGESRSRSKWRRLLPHAKCALSYGPGKEVNEDRTILLWKCAMALLSDGRYDESEKLFLEVMDTRKRELGDEHHKTLGSISNLAMAYKGQGRWKEAVEMLVQVIEKMKRVLGEKHIDTLASMVNLASTLMNQGQWKEAEELEVQVIVTSKEVLGEEHPQTLSSMVNLGSTLMNQGRWKEAEELFVQIIETQTRAVGEDHPDTLASIGNLASTFWNQGRWKEAEELAMRVIEIQKRVLGDEHPFTLTSMANLAMTYRYQGRWKEAEELEVRVVEKRKRVLEDEHPDTLTSMVNLASTYRNQGRWKEAEDLFVQVIETGKRVLGETHPHMLTAMANLASTFVDQARWKDAEELGVQVVETRKRVLGEDHPDTLISMNNLALTLLEQGRWKEAEELLVQVTETGKRVLGEEHPNTLASMINLASTYKDQAKWKEAEEMEVKVIETMKKVLGEEHPKTLTTIANLATTFWNQGRLQETEKLEAQVVETRRRVFGEEHPDTLLGMANLASTYRSQGRTDESIMLMARCAKLRMRALGLRHPDTKKSLQLLNAWQSERVRIQ